MSRPIYFEVCAEEPEKLLTFYHAVLGWQVQARAPGQQYWQVVTGGDGQPGVNGGFMHRHFQQGVINTVLVASLKHTLALVEAHGGRVIHGPLTIPNVGLQADCEDPQGIVFGVHESLTPQAGG